MKPSKKTVCPNFSSGPCAKRPGWKAENLFINDLGRSHRSDLGHERLKLCIDLMREVLQVPQDYRIGILPASDTGAIEAAMWSLLGPRGIDVFAWDTFGKNWYKDIKDQLHLTDLNAYVAPYGELPDLSKADFNRDIVFTWNGTTSGVCIPNGDWIKSDRQGLTICDATSGAFAMDLPWDKLDVTTFSWQKALGGEAAHGVIILSPRAVERLTSYTPSWPMPKIFRMTNNNELIEGIFVGDTINTPSMLCVEDFIDALTWAKSVGGLKGLMKRSRDSYNAVAEFVKKTSWIEFLAEDESYRSNTSVCLKVVSEEFKKLDADSQKAFCKKITKMLAQEGVAYDCNSYKDAPVGFRIWCGATIETSDVKILLEWLDWAYNSVLAENN
ncbi:MAG: phosphoserine transaminase [Alphaproteobacteria bacterium]|nr:phosphoserine transaminase [Alphaproteobacteria bacterium]